MKGNIYIKVNKIVYKHSVSAHQGNRIPGKELNYENYKYFLYGSIYNTVGGRRKNKDLIPGLGPVERSG